MSIRSVSHIVYLHPVHWVKGSIQMIYRVYSCIGFRFSVNVNVTPLVMLTRLHTSDNQ